MQSTSPVRLLTRLEQLELLKMCFNTTILGEGQTHTMHGKKFSSVDTDQLFRT